MDATLPYKIAGAIALALTGISTTTTSSSEVPVVRSIDFKRYAGTWFEQARLPNRFQRDCAGDVSATYALNADGTVDVLNSCRTGDGKIDAARGLAKAVDSTQPGLLDVTFLPRGLRWLPFGHAQYRIVALDPDYRWAIVGGENNKYLWLLAREPQLDAVQRELLVDRARELGFDVARLQFSSRLAPDPSLAGE
jgi:apolipoprotein D and lipocalin family protein